MNWDPQFDQSIKQKANESNRYVEFEFNKTKIHLKLRDFNIFIKLQEPKLILKGNAIILSRVELVLSLKSLYASKAILKSIEVEFKKNNIRNNNLQVWKFLIQAIRLIFILLN